MGTVSEIAMLATAALVAGWFRYTCRVARRAARRDYTAHVAKANQLKFLEVQRALLSAPHESQLDPLAQKLEQDYRMLSYLLRHGPAIQALRARIEQRMVMLNFQLLKAYFAVTRTVLRSKGRRALEEMAQVVGYLANQMGARAAFPAGR
jgi:hypothetical protein